MRGGTRHLVLPIPRRIWILAGGNCILAANSTVAALHNQLSTALSMERLSCRFDCFALRSVDPAGTAGIVALFGPPFSSAEDRSVSSFHRLAVYFYARLSATVLLSRRASALVIIPVSFAPEYSEVPSILRTLSKLRGSHDRQTKNLSRDGGLLRRLSHAQALRNDDHVGGGFADLESFLEQRRVEGGLEIEAKERLGQSLAHFVE